ncbi:MAG: hypothetical protein LBH28_02510 [Oscillospiraceae bacterium]|jgi:hypothetical protein|nr:hypothetical protein [Oscillospiraceae bacterium]
MKKHILLTIIFILAIIIGGAMSVSASGIDAPFITEEDFYAPAPPPYRGDGVLYGENVVYTEEELAEWCYERNGICGTGYLGGNVTIEQGISGNYLGGHIVIDTGEYGLVYDGGKIMLNDFEITGEGIGGTPVVTVIDVGPNWGMGNWNNALANTNITATGSNGTGGVALQVISDDGMRFDMFMGSGEFCCIRSYGGGAIGILSDVPLDLYCFRVETNGDNSIAVSAPAGTALYYCRLDSAGKGAAVATGGVALDSCIASPQPDNDSVITRTVSDVSGKRFYMFVKRYADWIAPEFVYTFWLTGSDGSVIKQSFMVYWDMAAIDAIDTDIPGSYIISGSLDYIYDGFGLTDGFPLTLTIEVRDPAVPTIGGVYFSDWDGNIASLDLWNTYDPADGSLILWRSDDGGETWHDFTDSPDLVWVDWNTTVEFHYDAITSPIMFCLEVVGVGESNVVTLYEKDGVPFGDNGGDRTGTDRQGGGNPIFNDPGDNTGGNNNGGGADAGDNNGEDNNSEENNDANGVNDANDADNSAGASPDEVENDADLLGDNENIDENIGTMENSERNVPTAIWPGYVTSGGSINGAVSGSSFEGAVSGDNTMVAANGDNFENAVGNDSYKTTVNRDSYENAVNGGSIVEDHTNVSIGSEGTDTIVVTKTIADVRPVNGNTGRGSNTNITGSGTALGDDRTAAMTVLPGITSDTEDRSQTPKSTRVEIPETTISADDPPPLGGDGPRAVHSCGKTGNRADFNCVCRAFMLWLAGLVETPQVDQS